MCTTCLDIDYFFNGPLTRYVKLRVAHAPWMPGTISPSPWFSDPDMHHGTCVTPVPWCMPGSLTSGFLWKRWQGKLSRHSRRMRNPQFYVSGKRPMGRRQAIWTVRDKRICVCVCRKYTRSAIPNVSLWLGIGRMRPYNLESLHQHRHNMRLSHCQWGSCEYCG